MNVLNFNRKGVEKTADSGRLLLAGSDDLLFGQTLTLFHKKAPGIVAFFANLGSMGGIKCLRRGSCHIGVCHLLQDDNNEYNFDFAEKELDRLPVFVNFSKCEQGILLRKGNPKNIKSIADLAQPGATSLLQVGRFFCRLRSFTLRYNGLSRYFNQWRITT